MLTRPLLPILMLFALMTPGVALAAPPPLDFTVNTSEAVVVDTTNGTPSIDLDVGGVTRQATYHSGSNSSALVFRYTPVVGDVDLDGVSLGSAINPNSGILTDASGNPMTNFTVTPPSTPNVKINYPSLSMDFVADADGRYTLNGTAYDTLATFLSAAGGTFTRSSIGTYFDSSGVLQTASANTPRFDHDPVTHAAKGILIEESRTNRTLYSKDFDNANWTPGSLITANTTIAPDGTMTADTLTQTTATNSEFIRDQNISATANTTYTFSLFFKPGTRTTDFSVMLDWADFSSLRVSLLYNYTNQNITTGGSGASRISTASVQSLSNGWYRMALTFTTDSTVGHIVSMIGRFGNGPGTTYIWGAQLEQGAFPTSYIPTTTAAVTRVDDNLYLETASIPGWNTTEGTWYSEFARPISSSITFPFIIYANNGAEFVTDRMAANSVGTWNGSTEVNVSGNPVERKFTSSYDSSGRYLALNGTLNSGTGSYTLGSTTRIYIGGSSNAARMGHSPVGKVKYYPTRLPNTQLQLLTQ